MKSPSKEPISQTGYELVNQRINTLRPRQNGCHFADYSIKCVFLNENAWISIIIPLKFVPKGPINIIPALVQIMAWRRSGDKPLSEPIMVSLLTHVCVTRPQCINSLWLNKKHQVSYFHKFSQNVMRARLPWHAQNCDLIRSFISYKSITYLLQNDDYKLVNVYENSSMLFRQLDTRNNARCCLK